MKYFLPFKSYNVNQVFSNLSICRTELFQNSFLRFTISEWNKLDTDVRNMKTYLLFRENLLALIRPIENSIYNIYDPLGIKLLHILRLGFSHLREHNVRHNSSLQVCNFNKKRLQFRCFPVTIAKLLGTTF